MNLHQDPELTQHHKVVLPIQIDKFYPVKVWLFSIILGPIPFILVMLFGDQGFEEIQPIKIYSFIFYGASLFSIPSLFISVAAFRLLLLINLKTALIKLLLILLGLGLFATTFYLMGNPLHQLDLNSSIIPLSFTFCFLLASICFKIKRRYYV